MDSLVSLAVTSSEYICSLMIDSLTGNSPKIINYLVITVFHYHSSPHRRGTLSPRENEERVYTNSFRGTHGAKSQNYIFFQMR
jgi:hypothetical protein